MLLLLACNILCLLSTASSLRIDVVGGDQLEKFLCNGSPITEDTVTVLSTNITHVISNVSLCIINTTYSLTLISDSSLPAIVQCNRSMMQPTSGFAFVNAHKLTLQRLVFSGCGGYLRKLDAINDTDSPFYFTSYQSAVLVFLHINTLLISDVNITRYYGFAVLAINPTNALFHGISIKMHANSFGSGLLFLFADLANDARFNVAANIYIYQATVWYNKNQIPDHYCPFDKHHITGPFPIISASGLTIMYMQQRFLVKLELKESHFYFNSGSGAILIMHYNTTASINTKISSTSFSENSAEFYCLGMSLTFIEYFGKQKDVNNSKTILQHFSVLNSTFIRNGFGYDIFNKMKTVIFIQSINPPNVLFNISFINVTFAFNRAVESPCMYVATHENCDDDSMSSRKKHLQIFLQNVTVEKNVALLSPFFNTDIADGFSLFTLSNIYKLYITGLSRFTDNVGSLFNVTNSNIILDGNLYFARNKGGFGTVFLLHGSSIIYLCSGLRAKLIQNVALTQGGVMYSYNQNCLHNKCYCVLQAENSQLYVSLLFINNTASESGDNVISASLVDCYMRFNQQIYNSSNVRRYLHRISKGTLDYGLSTIPSNLCICSHGQCSSFKDLILVYAGQKVYIPVAAIDGFGQSAFAEVNIGIYEFKNTYIIPIFSWNVSSVKQILLPQNSCTVIKVIFYKRFSKNYSSRPFLALNGNPSYVNRAAQPLKISLDLQDCPIGFQFIKEIGSCECSEVLYSLNYQPVCKITFFLHQNSFPIITITKPLNSKSWIGIIENPTNNSNKAFATAPSCHIYCNFKRKYTLFIVRGSDIKLADSKNTSENISLCIENREGPFCSQCTPGYSTVFGSAQCKQCSNWWLLTLIAYAAAGPLLIYLLYAFKLTLNTGILNGIILYAQMVALVDYPGLYHSSLLYDFFLFTKGLISLFNLSLYYPLCFYNGMSELMKAGLNLVFPFYLLIIVIGLIIMSRYSIKLSNKISHLSVQVLVTVVHLSFARLLTSITDIFSSIKVHTNTTEVPLLVWANDGSVEYGKGGHLILMSITSLIVGPLLIVYTTVLLAGRLLLKNKRLREYLRPVYEAIHAPYKRKKEFFFPAQLLLVVFVYIFYCQEQPFIVLYATMLLLILYCATSIYLSPFKASWLNFINAYFLVIILAGFISYWYLLQFDKLEDLVILWSIVTLLVLASFMVIVIAHVLSVKGMLDKLFSSKLNQFFQESYSIRYGRYKRNDQDSFNEPCLDFREPLLSPTH